jgi:hypothetical protein
MRDWQTDDRRYIRRSNDLLATDLGDEVVVYDDLVDLAHVLNEPAATVWRMCNGDSTAAEICDAVAAIMDVEHDIAEVATYDALVQLGRLNLLDTPAPEDASMSRRRMLKLAGAAAGAVFAVPLIETLGLTPETAEARVGTTPGGRTTRPREPRQRWSPRRLGEHDQPIRSIDFLGGETDIISGSNDGQVS